MNFLVCISRWLGQRRRAGQARVSKHGHTVRQGRRQKAEGRKVFWLLPSAFCLAIALVMMTAGDALACPMCKAALGSQDRLHGDWVGGFFWSILFMLSMPFLIFSSLSAYMYVLVRRARREAAERGKPPR